MGLINVRKGLKEQVSTNPSGAENRILTLLAKKLQAYYCCYILAPIGTLHPLHIYISDNSRANQVRVKIFIRWEKRFMAIDKTIITSAQFHRYCNSSPRLTELHNV